MNIFGELRRRVPRAVSHKNNDAQTFHARKNLNSLAGQYNNTFEIKSGVYHAGPQTRELRQLGIIRS